LEGLQQDLVSGLQQCLAKRIEPFILVGMVTLWSIKSAPLTLGPASDRPMLQLIPTRLLAPPSPATLQKISRGVAVITIGIGSLVLLGWQLDWMPLKTGFTGGQTTMKANAALSFLLAGSSFGLRTGEKQQGQRANLSELLSRSFAIAVLSIGLLTLSQYLLGWNLGIDQFLFRDDAAPILHSGRMGPTTALNFFLVGLALLLFRNYTHRSYRTAQIAVLIVILIALRSLVGYAYAVRELYQFGAYATPMALPTAITFILLGIGLLCAHPNEGLMRLLTGDQEGSFAARQLLPAAIVLPLILGWSILRLQQAGHYDVAFGMSLLVLTLAVMASLLIWCTATTLNQNASDRQQMDAALRHSEARYRYLTEAIPQLVWLSDTTGRIEYMNQQMCDYTGLMPEQLPIQGWQTLIHPDDMQQAQEQWMTAVQQSHFYETEHRVKDRNGQYQWHLVRATPLRNEQGEILQWLGTSTNIETHKQLDAECKAALQRECVARQDAEVANRLKDEFLAVLSHELRTPLNPILGWIKILRKRKTVDSVQLSQALEIMERNAKLQSNLIEDILDVSSLLKGQFQLAQNPVNLVGVIRAAIATLQQAAAKSIQLNWHEPAHSIWVMGDRERLQQVVWNLLSNAVKFTPPGGQITVKLSVITEPYPFAERAQDECSFTSSPAIWPILSHATAVSTAVTSITYAQIQITDTGIGIAPDFLPHLFERFRQADSSSTRRFGGLGLGLALVRHLIELHGGILQATSLGEGQGATFTVLLPLLQTEKYVD
jgi:PAS domain S-box-containing protein